MKRTPKTSAVGAAAGIAKRVIGRRELVALPEWRIAKLRAKIDTGARSCALDVDNLRIAADVVHFDIVLSLDRSRRRRVHAPLKRKSRVKPSSGERQTRPVVETTLRIGDVERRIEISLVPRKGMLCRMLLGRTALRRHFLVDPDAKYLLGQPREKVREP